MKRLCYCVITIEHTMSPSKAKKAKLSVERSSDYKDFVSQEKEKLQLTVEPLGLNITFSPLTVWLNGKIVKKEKPRNGKNPSFARKIKRGKACFNTSEKNYEKDNKEQLEAIFDLIRVASNRTIKVFANDHKLRANKETEKSFANTYDVPGIIDFKYCEPLDYGSDDSEDEGSNSSSSEE